MQSRGAPYSDIREQTASRASERGVQAAHSAQATLLRAAGPFDPRGPVSTLPKPICQQIPLFIYKMAASIVSTRASRSRYGRARLHRDQSGLSLAARKRADLPGMHLLCAHESYAAAKSLFEGGGLRVSKPCSPWARWRVTSSCGGCGTTHGSRFVPGDLHAGGPPWVHPSTFTSRRLVRYGPGLLPRTPGAGGGVDLDCSLDAKRVLDE